MTQKCIKLCPKLSYIHLSTDKHEVAARRNDLRDQMSEVGFKTSCCFLSIIKLQSYWMEDIAKILTQTDYAQGGGSKTCRWRASFWLSDSGRYLGSRTSRSCLTVLYFTNSTIG